MDFELFKKQHFCLSVMDILLSEMNGAELLQAKSVPNQRR